MWSSVVCLSHGRLSYMISYNLHWLFQVVITSAHFYCLLVCRVCWWMDGCHKNWVNSDDTAMKDLLTGRLLPFIQRCLVPPPWWRQFWWNCLSVFYSHPYITLSTLDTKEGKTRAWMSFTPIFLLLANGAFPSISLSNKSNLQGHITVPGQDWASCHLGKYKVADITGVLRRWDVQHTSLWRMSLMQRELFPPLLLLLLLCASL